MKIIGLIGGMSWESSAEYYRIINQRVRASLGGQHSARLLMYSVDFHDIALLQSEGRWQEAAQAMADAARRLEGAGADCLVLCANTMHKLSADIEEAVQIPLLHVADATAVEVVRAGIECVGLLGTRYTMEEDFYRVRLESKHGLKVIVPDRPDRTVIHDVIYQELCQGRLLEKSKREFLRIIQSLARRGAGGIVLGCTEIPLLIKPEDTSHPLFDTMAIHAEAAVRWALH